MDHQGRRSRPLIGVFVAIGCVFGAARAAEGPLRAMRWMAPGANHLRTLGERPAECLKRPETRDVAYSVEIGRAAFRTPLLLGGQAARAGVACETCHEGGHTNPEFLFPGVSGAPGTADVTNSLFSSHRGDGVDNPKPIPDLGGPRARLKVSQDLRGRALETFIHGLVTEEFDGPEPTPAVLGGLADYVRHLQPQACPRRAVEQVIAGVYIADARRAVTAAGKAFARKDRATAAFLATAGRAQLGLLYERYDTPSLTEDRANLQRADHELAVAAEAARAGDPMTGKLLNTWLGRSLAWGAQLQRDEPRSLFNVKRLAGV